MKKSSDSLWDSFSYLTIEQKKSIVELTNSYEKPIIPRVLQEENVKETPFLFDRNVSFNAILFHYYDSIDKIENSSLEEFKLKESLGELKKRKSILNNASKNINKMIEGLNHVRDLQQKVGNNFDEIFKVREKSLNKLSETNKDLLLLKTFSDKLNAIESLQDPKASLYSTESKCEFLNKVDNLWDFLKDYECFQDFTKYCRILDLSRQSVLKSISNSMESVLNNAVNDTVENIKNQSEIEYHLIGASFKNSVETFNKHFTCISHRRTSHPDYDNLVNYISDKYIISRLGLLTGLANSSVQVISTEHDNLVTLINIMCCLFMRICDNEHLLYTSFFVGSEDTASNLMLVINKLLYDTLSPYFVQIKTIDLLCEIVHALSHDVLALDSPLDKSKWWDIYSNNLNTIIGDMQARMIFLTQKHIDLNIVKYKFNPAVESLESDFYPILETCNLLDKLFSSFTKHVFEKIAQECIDSVVKLIDVSFESIYLMPKKILDSYMFAIKNLLHLREKMTTFDVNFITRDVILEFGDLKKAASELFKNKSNILSLSSNNALLVFFLSGAPTLCEKWIDSKKEIELKIRSYCLRMIEHSVDIMTCIIKKTSSQLEETSFDQEKKFHPADMKNITQEIYSTIRLKSTEIRQIMSNYLHNSETEDILFKPIKINVIELYRILSIKVDSKFSKDEKLLISMPLIEQISLLLS